MGGVTRSNPITDVEAFLDQAREIAPRAQGAGRLIFAMDATLSRQPTWDLAQGLQQEMFRAAAALGGLDVQLAYFRGAGECRASRFVQEGEGLARLMAKIECQGGYTQIEKILRHAQEETTQAPVGALIFIGDAMEENPDKLCAMARELAQRGLKIFMFQEGEDSKASATFKEIARISGGAYAAFNADAPQRLKALLSAVGSYASGGRLALANKARSGDRAAQTLLEQISR